MLFVRATSPAELQEIFKFRYDVYAKFMGKHFSYYDHEAKLIREDLDADARNYALRDTYNNLIGTIRLNYSTEIPLEKELALLSIDKALIPSERYCLASKLILQPDYWKSGRATIFLKKIYQKLLEDEIDFVYLYCFDKTLAFFQKFGFILLQTQITYRDYQNLNVLRLALKDIEHLKSVRSPFYKFYLAYEKNSQEMM